jgi:hypothetical protein
MGKRLKVNFSFVQSEYTRPGESNYLPSLHELGTSFVKLLISTNGDNNMRKTDGPSNDELIEYFASLDPSDRELVLMNTGIEPYIFHGVIEDFLSKKARNLNIDPELELLKIASQRRTRTARKKSTIYSTWLATALKARAAGYSYDMILEHINAKQTRYKISKSYLYHLLVPFADVIERMKQGRTPSAEEIEDITAGRHTYEN